ncbi:DUF4825 domain-containing protein [Clostridium sp. PL3]|uniref:DUF4825 domain-containing protein n=1 Tax=Clostridium thailandense TaxID=2794346 RepID=A0A949TVC4_9CLOT|nr:DUF4825 domain-containing protein [Clostridium thailandense]MBV7272551.1 DUF4825 domain-containing protein [Clostridium thailandense]
MKRRFSLFCTLLIILLSVTSCQSNNSSNVNNTEQISLTRLIKYKDSDVGNNLAVSNILSNLPGALYVKQISLQTKSSPFGISVDYGLRQDTNVKESNLKEYWSEKNTKKIFLNNATTLFILINNVATVNFNVNHQSFSISREELKNFYGRDLNEYANKTALWEKEIFKETLNSNEKIDEFYKIHSIAIK